MIYKVATSTNKILLRSNQKTLLNNELYRFVENPALHFPVILELLTSSEFRNLFERNHPQIRIAGLHLRLSSPSKVQSHTTSFHRDYNGYYTLKLFLPLSEFKTPFLEYIPSTEIITTAIPHYRPNHLRLEHLPARIQNRNKEYSSNDITNLLLIPTNTIHREQPCHETRLNLIITYLSHPDYGSNKPLCALSELKSRKIDDWTNHHLAFFQHS